MNHTLRMGTDHRGRVCGGVTQGKTIPVSREQKYRGSANSIVPHLIPLSISVSLFGLFTVLLCCIVLCKSYLKINEQKQNTTLTSPWSGLNHLSHCKVVAAPANLLPFDGYRLYASRKSDRLVEPTAPPSSCWEPFIMHQSAGTPPVIGRPV